MKRSAFTLLALLSSLPQAIAVEPSADPPSEAQRLGMRLFNQSCVVCHAKPQITSVQYGPTLSQESAGGRDDVMRGVISNGTPRMPGFKYQFEPPLIDAIVAYLKTVPAPAPPAAPAGR